MQAHNENKKAGSQKSESTRFLLASVGHLKRVPPSHQPAPCKPNERTIIDARDHLITLFEDLEED